MSIPQVESGTTYQQLEQNPTTFSYRLAQRCFSVKGLTLLCTGIALIATSIYYLTMHRSNTEIDVDDHFPHDFVFSFYCKETCSLLYKFTQDQMQSCKKYCDDTSTHTFPNVCILACDKLGTSVLLKCIKSCK
ncbi:MAG: hypothetical protein LBC45_00575 [Chlamydiales bacterium]|jgi:hypothetical protein|nr:hypothetical protein [Chlamydiales bacterium]